MTKVFLDYAQQDKQTACKLTYDLERNGITVWCDEFEMKLGDNVTEKVTEGLANSSHILLLLSKGRDVNQLINDVVKENKEVVIVVLDDLELPSASLEKFSVYLYETYDTALDQLLSHLTNEPKKIGGQEQRSRAKSKQIEAEDAKSLPRSLANGYLPEGIHETSVATFIDRFTSASERLKYRKSLLHIIDFAKNKQAAYILFGGLLTTSQYSPNGINAIIVFNQVIDVPSMQGKLVVDNTAIDVYYATLDERRTLDTLNKFISTMPNGQRIGIVKVGLSKHALPTSQTLVTKEQPNPLINLFQPRGILVTVHGLLSKAEWNTEIAPIASSQGWIFAPYVYRSNCVDLLIRKKKRKRIVDAFREWIFDIQMRHKGVPISVIAHSFGTYIIADYLAGFNENIPVRFQTIILTGSIINPVYDWQKKYEQSKVIRVRNEVATNDNWVQRIPDGLFRLNKKFGQSGIDGFANQSEILTENANKIFNHSNVIRRDVVEQIWMPYLNANSNLGYLE